MGAMASTPTAEVSSGIARANVASAIEAGTAAGSADGPAVSSPNAHVRAEPARHVSGSGMRSDVHQRGERGGEQPHCSGPGHEPDRGGELPTDPPTPACSGVSNRIAPS